MRAPNLAAAAMIFALLSAACSTPPAVLEGPPDGQADAAVPADAASCDPGPLPAQLAATPGGRVEVLLSPPAGAVVEVRAPTDWRVDARDGSKIGVRLPYSASGDAMLEVHAVCGSLQATGMIPVHIKALAWSSVAQWDPSIAMAPKARQFASLWFDPTDPGRLLVHGGVAGNHIFDDLWAFSLGESKWDLLSASSGLPIGESGPVAVVPNQTAGYFVDTLSGWSGSGTTFTLLRFDYGGEGVHTSSVPGTHAPAAALEAGSFIYDSRNARYVSACGVLDGVLDCSVAIFDPALGQWSEPTVEADSGQTPSGRYGFAYGYDEPNARLLIFSGGQDATSANPVNPAQDTWALELGADPIRWHKLPSAGDQPPGRRNSCAAVDPVGHRLLVWGGTPDLMNIVPGLYALDLDAGFESWTRIDAPSAPPPRSGCAAVYDPARSQMLFGLGNSRSAIYTDLWALSL